MVAQFVNKQRSMYRRRQTLLVMIPASLVFTRIESEDMRGVTYPHGIPCRSYTMYREHTVTQFSSFEALFCKRTSTYFCAQVICLNRQPGYPTFVFEQFQDLLENMSSFSYFNLHLDSPPNHTKTFFRFVNIFWSASTC